MRKKIQDLAYARFQYEKPALEFSIDRLEFEVLRDESSRGSFSLTSSNQVPMRGIIYSSNPRMECLTPEFEGTEACIQYEFHSEGLAEGDIQKGDFYIICDGGEYNLSFVAAVSRFYPETSVGKVKNLFDFANLAQDSYEEAYRIFQAPFFQNIIKKTEVREGLLYRALGGAEASIQGMEEFLIGIRKKQKVCFTLEEESRDYTADDQDRKEILRIKKEHWGYLELSITSDCQAISPVKSRICTQDFVGNYAEAEFIIRADQLHEGNNYGRLVFESLNQTKVCEICIRRKRQNPSTERAEIKRLLARLVRLYLDFRLQKIVTGVWSRESCSCLERLRELEPKNLWYVLYHAQALIVNKQRQEAQWSLDAFCREPVEKDTPLYAYYLYLETLKESEPSYGARLFAQIREIYHRNQDDIRLFFIMLFLDPQLNQSRSRKLQAIEEKINGGMHSPVLYMEAYTIVKREPYLLQKADTFEMQLLYWAAREKVLSQEVTAQVHKLAASLRRYHPLWYKLLKACYQLKQEKELLQSLCSFCIKWNLHSREQFQWYDLGIQENLRIAGLYEAWMNGAGRKDIQQFPKTVMLYFQYQNSLTYKKQALLYACIIESKEEQKGLYSAYQKSMEHFAAEQLLAGHIDENLAVLYEEMLKHLTITREIAQALAKVLYANRLICTDAHAKRVVVIHHELNQEQSVLLVNHQAYIRLYTGAHCIMMEDERGIRYLPQESWELKRLMQPAHYVKECIRQAEDELPHLIYYFEGRKTWHTYAENDLKCLRDLMENAAVSQDYKNEIKPQIIEYYYNSFSGTALDEYLKQVDYSGLKRDIKNKLMELMIARGVYDKAFAMIRAFGSEQASISKLLIIASQKIIEQGYEPDPTLLGLCHNIFKRGKYNEYILKYLCSYLQSDVQELEMLWRAAREFEADTYELEERFLVQLLYTEGYTQGMEEVFQSYFEAHGKEMVILAYLSYFSCQYFVKRTVTTDVMFLDMEQQLLLDNPLNDICRLAYTQWVTGRKQRTQEQERLLEQLLEEWIRRKKYFGFYRELPQRLLRRYHLYDRVFLEYRTSPGHRVSISYSYSQPEEEALYTEEEMEQMYEGVFVKQFIVFFGEEIPYYIREEDEKGELITQSGHIQMHDLMGQGDESCYDLINGMMISYHLKDAQTLRQLNLQYREQIRLTEEKFRLI